MRTRTTERVGRIARGVLALLLALSTSVAGAALSSAAPSKREVEAAEAELEALNQRLSLLVEEYNQQRARLDRIQTELADARNDMQRAEDEARGALATLNARAASAYQDVGSQLEMLLGAESLAEFSDRLEFMGRMAQADADLATQAQRARQEARWAADRLHAAELEQQRLVASLAAKEDEIQASVDEAERLYERLDREYRDFQAEQRAAAAAAAAAADAGATTTISPPPGGPPPASNPNAQAAIDAAYSVIGTPYVWGASDPDVGFDCSGLTMWAWAHAGVSLPHSSQMQYDVLPHVSRDDIQPGDLLFFYTPISHVGLYIGGSQMIDANHPGDVVNIRPVHWEYFVGAARP